MRSLLRLPALLLALATATPALASSIDLVAEDGTALKAAHAGRGAKGVVLVHERGRSSADWSTFSDRLSRAGFQVVAVDLRGHGDSHRPESMDAEVYAAMAQDVAAAVAWIRARGAQEVMLVGAGLGANISLHVAADDPGVQNLVMVSPGLNLSGYTVGNALERYGERPLLLVAAQGDQQSMRAVTFLEGRAQGPNELRVREGREGGARLFNRDVELQGMMLAWLNMSFEPVETPAQELPQRQRSQDARLETTGERIGEPRSD